MVEQREWVFLDLDETLLRALADEDTCNCNQIELNSILSLLGEGIDMEGYYRIYERPGLQDFLSKLFKEFNVGVWTAASKDYCAFIIDNIILKDPSRNLQWVFWNEHGDKSFNRYNGAPKKLQQLWEVYKLPGLTSQNVVIIDDYYKVYSTQPENAILIPKFEAEKNNSHADKVLDNIWEALIKWKQNRNDGGNTPPCQFFNINNVSTPNQLNDDYEGQIKNCKGCSYDFTTYTNKDYCPECRIKPQFASVSEKSILTSNVVSTLTPITAPAPDLAPVPAPVPAPTPIPALAPTPTPAPTDVLTIPSIDSIDLPTVNSSTISAPTLSIDSSIPAPSIDQSTTPSVDSLNTSLQPNGPKPDISEEERAEGGAWVVCRKCNPPEWFLTFSGSLYCPDCR